MFFFSTSRKERNLQFWTLSFQIFQVNVVLMPLHLNHIYQCQKLTSKAKPFFYAAPVRHFSIGRTERKYTRQDEHFHDSWQQLSDNGITKFPAKMELYVASIPISIKLRTQQHVHFVWIDKFYKRSTTFTVSLALKHISPTEISRKCP